MSVEKVTAKRDTEPARKEKSMDPKVMHIRLINSDEIIGELQKIRKNDILIKKPMVVSEREDPRTKVSTVVLSKYVLFNDEQAISFRRDHVITLTDVIEEIRKYYYNSIEYNKLYVEPNVQEEIGKVNELMEGILTAPTQVIEHIQVYAPLSNTVH